MIIAGPSGKNSADAEVNKIIISSSRSIVGIVNMEVELTVVLLVRLVVMVKSKELSGDLRDTLHSTLQIASGRSWRRRIGSIFGR